MIKVIPNFAAAVAGFALVASAFVPMVGAQTMTTTSASATFTRDLTIGSTGADVTALQNWLISKGFAISAGATGYFGAQTKAALAAYQAANGITPAAGYFGPITRGRIAVVTQAVLPTPVPPVVDGNDNEEDEDEEELEIEVEFRDGRAYIEINEDGDTESFTLRTTSRTRVIEDVAERLDLDEDDVEDIIEFSTEDEDEDEDNHTRSSAESRDVSGPDNDVATFEIIFDVEAIGAEMYIPRDADDAFTYRIENASNGSTVSSQTSLNAVLSSDADTEGSSYVVSEGDEEEFTVQISFNPLPQDESQNYRLQLLTLRYGTEEGQNNRTFNLRPETKYESEPVYIAD